MIRSMWLRYHGTGLLVFLVGALLSASVLAEGELLLFPEIRFEHQQGDSLGDIGTTPSLDLFGTAHRGQLRLLGEMVVSDDEVEIERLQLGYAVSPGTTLWAGRVHNPLGYWITQYHHGSYLQTSISRPEVARFDDQGGLFPSHITGLLLDATHTRENQAFDYALLVGAGPELRTGNNSTLHSVDLFDIDNGKHRLNITGRFAYRPDSASGSQIGLFANYVEMPIRNTSNDTLELTIAGAFSYWQFTDLTLTGALYLARDELDSRGTKESGNFASGYVQADYLAYEEWTPYTRFEKSFGDDNDPYVELMNDFIPSRQMLGVRWDFSAW